MPVRTPEADPRLCSHGKRPFSPPKLMKRLPREMELVLLVA